MIENEDKSLVKDLIKIIPFKNICILLLNLCI